jgi:hypothetical protein
VKGSVEGKCLEGDLEVTGEGVSSLHPRFPYSKGAGHIHIRFTNNKRASQFSKSAEISFSPE